MMSKAVSGTERVFIFTNTFKTTASGDPTGTSGGAGCG